MAEIRVVPLNHLGPFPCSAPTFQCSIPKIGSPHSNITQFDIDDEGNEDLQPTGADGTGFEETEPAVEEDYDAAGEGEDFQPPCTENTRNIHAARLDEHEVAELGPDQDECSDETYTGENQEECLVADWRYSFGTVTDDLATEEPATRSYLQIQPVF